MPTRDLVVRLRGDEADLIRAYRAIEQAAVKHGAVMQRQAKQQQKDFTEVGRVFLGIGVAAGIGLGAMVKAGMGFDKAMSGVKAVTNASAADMNRLREAAIKAGKDTVFSASEAARAEAELAKAGIATSDILGGALKGSLSLAAAGQLDLGEAATISAQAMNIFKLRGSDVGHIADVLAAGANKSAADVHQLGDALRAGGLVAAQTGLTLEDTVGALSAFADRALIGSDAGTSLKTMLLSLNPKSSEAARLMKQLGITAYDASGQFVGLEAFAGRLQKGLGGLTAEQRNSTLATIFGTDAVRGANVLYELGSAGVAKYTAAVNDQGAASRMAATQLDNLAGDLEALKGSIETALIQSGSHANGVLREMVQTATGVVNIYSDLPKPVQAAGTALTGLTAAAGLTAGAFFIGAPKVAAFKSSLNEMGPGTQRAGRALLGMGGLLAGPWGIALAAGTVGLGFFAQRHAAAKAKVDALTEAIRADAGALGEQTRQMVVSRLEQDGLLRSAEQLGINLADVTDAVMGNAQAQARVNLAIAEAQRQFAGLSSAVGTHQGISEAEYQTAAKRVGIANKLSQALGGVTGDLAEAGDQARRQGQAMDQSAGATKGASGAADMLSGTTQTVTQDLKDERTAAEKLKDELDRLTGATLTADSAAIDWQQSIDDATKAAKTNGRTLDINTQKGRDNSRALIDMARKAQDHVVALQDEGASVETVSRTYVDHRAQLLAVARRMGLNKEESRRLINQYLKTPDSISTNFEANTKPARDAAKKLTTDYNTFLDRISDENVQIRLGISGAALSILKNSATSLAREHMNRRAMGGPIPGHSPNPTADNIPVMATAGEHMWSVREVAGAGGHGNVKRLRAMARTGTLQLGVGGPVVKMFSSGSLANMRIAADIAGDTRRAIAASYRYQLQAIVNAAAAGMIGGAGGNAGYRGGSGVERWRGVALQALALAGSPASWIGSLLRRMNQESGGNPRAINLWDSNARAGTPSIGLMQTIGPTFNAYAGSLRSRGIYDPLANIYASIRYANARYGSAPRGWDRAGGYDSGGWLPPGLSLAYNGTGRPERVLAPVGSNGGGGVTHVHVHLENRGVIGSRLEAENWLAKSLDNLRRQGRLAS